jgi:hypothetical protein
MDPGSPPQLPARSVASSQVQGAASAQELALDGPDAIASDARDLGVAEAGGQEHSSRRWRCGTSSSERNASWYSAVAKSGDVGRRSDGMQPAVNAYESVNASRVAIRESHQ